MTELQLLELARAAGYQAGLISTGEIRFDPAFRAYCAENLCGNYGRNRSCPPACGSPEQMAARIRAKDRALVLRGQWDCPDWRDKEAVTGAKTAHNRGVLALRAAMAEAGLDPVMAGGGPCDLCEVCAGAEGQPCRMPEALFSCLSAYCVHVQDLCAAAGLPFASPEGQLSLFSLLAF